VGDNASPHHPAEGRVRQTLREALAQLDKRWRVRYLMLAPHRLGFFLAMVVLVASGAVVGAGAGGPRHGLAGLALCLGYAVSPTLVHSAVMVLGFIPLFFAGFLFTAGPKWLGVEAPLAKAVRPRCSAGGLGWLLWLAGAHLHAALAWPGLALACAGLVWMTVQFWGRVRLQPGGRPAPCPRDWLCLRAGV
jgi:uncharacterized protein involved in response to NO